MPKKLLYLSGLLHIFPSAENLVRCFRMRHSTVSHDWTPSLLHSFQSWRTGSSVNFYIRKLLNTLVRFHPFLSFFVHALDITRCALIVSY
jgi:hypothetical protein